MPQIINIPLVDDDDNIIGHGEKLEVHLKGLLHRAFSILVFNDEGEILIHQRAFGKYHSPGLWTNTCCGHPNEGESMEAAVHRRLQEEMGFDCSLSYSLRSDTKQFLTMALLRMKLIMSILALLMISLLLIQRKWLIINGFRFRKLKN